MKRLIFFVTAYALLYAVPVAAGRPFSTEDAGVAPHGEFQLELAQQSANYAAGGESMAIFITPILGLSDRFEFSAEIPYVRQSSDESETVSGIADMSLFLKSLLVEEREMVPALLLRTGVKFANGDTGEGLGSGDEDYDFMAVASKELGIFIFHASAGYTFAGNHYDPSIGNYAMYGVAFEIRLNRNMSLAFEVYGESDPAHGIRALDHHGIAPLAGFMYRFTPETVLDASYVIVLENSQRTEGVLSFGMSLILY